MEKESNKKKKKKKKKQNILAKIFAIFMLILSLGFVVVSILVYL